MLALVAASALIAGCPADVEQRLDALSERFDGQLRATNGWAWSWSALYGTMAIAQLAIAVALPRHERARADLLFGASASAVGTFSLPTLPMLRFVGPITTLRARWHEPDRCRLLADAESLDRRVAAEQATGGGWFGEVGNLLINTGIALGMGAGLGHWDTGLMTAAIGLVVGELVLRTFPVF